MFKNWGKLKVLPLKIFLKKTLKKQPNKAQYCFYSTSTGTYAPANSKYRTLDHNLCVVYFRESLLTAMAAHRSAEV